MSEIRGMLADSINRMFAEGISAPLLKAAEEGRWPAELWHMVEESGFTKLLLPEEAGGTNGDWTDAHPVLRAIGYYNAPLPLAETMVGNWLLAQAGLPVGDGACSILQQPPGNLLRMERDDQGGLVLSGNVTGVPWASHAGRLVVAGTVDGKPVIGLMKLGAPGMLITPGTNIAAEPRARIDFDQCRCFAFAPHDDKLPAESVLVYGALARAAEMVGALESVLQQTVRYAKEREQFGRPIGKFQAVQQMLAVLASEVTAAGIAVEAACEAATRWPARFEIAVAKIRAGQAAGTVAAIAHQVHGAMGFTYEHRLHLATRRLWSWRAEFGSESTWARQLGTYAIRRGGDKFWEDLTDRPNSTVAP
jgi:acyl-CoA dehydrogenase